MAKAREGYHPFVLYLPDELWERLKREAREESRSATGHVIHLLRERYAPKPEKKGDAV